MSWQKSDHSSPRSVPVSTPDKRIVMPVQRTLRNPHQEDGTPEKNDSEHLASKISAYARLDFDNYTFFVQTLQVVLGRRSNDDQDHSSYHTVDVHLSSKKAISRRHAKIFYNFGTQRFEISVSGRNGAFVDDLFVEKGITVPLVDGTKIQIGDIPFTFVLPSLEANEGGEKGSALASLNPSDALNLRTNLYLASASPKRDSGILDVKSRRESRADLVRRLSIARNKSLASSSNDEINALLKELEAIESHEDENFDPELIDKDVKKLLENTKSLTQEQILKEDDEIDELVKQHNFQQGVGLAYEAQPKNSLDMDISMLDQELASLAPLMDNIDNKESDKAGYVPPRYTPERTAPLMGKPAGPRMGKPATIQPPANKIYGKNPVPTGQFPSTYNLSVYPFPYQSSGMHNLMGPPPPKLEVLVETITSVPVVRLIVQYRAITLDQMPERAPICAFKSVEQLSTAPKLPVRRKDAPFRRNKVQSNKEAPEQFKGKPSVSILAMVSTVLRGPNKDGYTMNDIHEGIKALFPYYQYCQDGWQATVTHNVKFNKVFTTVSKAGLESEWRWAVDEKYLEEKEKTRKKQQEMSVARAKEAALRAVELRQKQGSPYSVSRPYSPAYPVSTLPPFLENGLSLQKPKSIAELASEIKRDSTYSSSGQYFQNTTIKDQLAANRSRSSSAVSPPTQKPKHESPSASPSPAPPLATLPAMSTDTKKSLTYLQKELITLYKARNLSYNTAVTTEIITKALATTIAQVNIIGAKAGCGDNALSFLVEKAPQQVSKILDIALTKSIKEREGESSRMGTPQPASPNKTPSSSGASGARPNPVAGPGSVLAGPTSTSASPAVPPSANRSVSPGSASPVPKSSSFGKPAGYSNLARPAFSGPGKTGFSKPGALAKPPQFLSNKQKRPADEAGPDTSKIIKLEE